MCSETARAPGRRAMPSQEASDGQRLCTGLGARLAVSLALFLPLTAAAETSDASSAAAEGTAEPALGVKEPSSAETVEPGIREPAVSKKKQRAKLTPAMEAMIEAAAKAAAQAATEVATKAAIKAATAAATEAASKAAIAAAKAAARQALKEARAAPAQRQNGESADSSAEEKAPVESAGRGSDPESTGSSISGVRGNQRNTLELILAGLSAIAVSIAFLGEAGIEYGFTFADHLEAGADLFLDQFSTVRSATEQSLTELSEVQTNGSSTTIAVAPRFRAYLSKDASGVFLGARLPLGWTSWDMSADARDASGQSISGSGSGLSMGAHLQAGYRHRLSGLWTLAAYGDLGFGLLRPDFGTLTESQKKDLPNLNGLAAEQSWSAARDALDSRQAFRPSIALLIGRQF